VAKRDKQRGGVAQAAPPAPAPPPPDAEPSEAAPATDDAPPPARLPAAAPPAVPPSPPARLRRRVIGNVSAIGVDTDGHRREAWIPGDVGDFPAYVVDSAPECFAEE